MAPSTVAPSPRGEGPLPSTPDKHCNVSFIERTVAIQVGERAQTKTFDIHRDLLKHYSGFFRLAIKNMESGNFREATDKVLKLPKEELETFALFRNWLYNNPHSLQAEKTKSDYELPYKTVIKMWCFADLCDIPLLKNYTTDLVISKLYNGNLYPIALADTKYIYENTGVGSGLRLLVAWYESKFYRSSITMKEAWRAVAKEPWYSSFAEELTLEKMATATFDDVAKRSFDRCRFHEHEPGAKCVGQGWKSY